MNAKETMGTFMPEILVYDTKFPIDTKTITLAGGAGLLARGTVIAFGKNSPGENGAPWTGGADQVADCILCDDADTGRDGGTTCVAHAYRAGHFCRQALILGTGAASLTKAAEKQLADAGIYLSGAML